MTRTELNARMQPWNDAEIARFQHRVVLFLDRGQAAARAEALADRLALRDQEGDDRRLCIECESFRGVACKQRRPFFIADLVLQRCVGFQPQIQ